MPYIAVKAYPKDTETQRKLAEKISEAVIEVLGCPEKAVTVSFESVKPEDWQEKIVKLEIEPNADKMLIVSGEKQY
jgi:4-oxalocrotonate tautomerase